MPDPQHIDPPEEAVKAAGVAALMKHNFRPYDETTRTILRAAAPAIREQERQRVREELLSPYAIEAAGQVMGKFGEPSTRGIREALEAACDALEDPDA